MTTRTELFDRLRALAKEAEDSGVLPTAGILFILCGAMDAGTELALFNHCIPFAVAQLERLTGEPDWTDDTLKV